MNTSAWRKQEAAENQRLEQILSKVLREAEFKVAPEKTMQILDIACGECREAETLVKVVQNLPNLRPEQGGVIPVRLLGTDLRDREVEDAARRFRSRQQAQFEFLVEDASKLDRNREIGGEFDLAFMRHQNFWDDPKVWRRIFAQGLAKLSEDGLLVITSYFDREHELAQKAIAEAGGELVITERNLESIELTYPGKSVDRHVAVFRKKR
jgi:hypothetical protein